MVKKNTVQPTPVQVTPAPVQVTPAPVQVTPAPAPVQVTKSRKQKGGDVPVPVSVPVSVSVPVPVPVLAPAPEQLTVSKKSKKTTPAPAVPVQTAPVQVTPVQVVEAETPVPVQAAGTKKPRAKTARQTKTKSNATTKPKKGGKKVVDVATVQADAPVEGEEKGRFFKYLYNGTVSGRFSGSKPKQAANKALTSIVKSQTETGVDLTNKMLTFSIIECTRGSKKKQYNYQGIRRALDNPIKVTIKNKDVPIVYKFQNKTSKLKAQPVATSSA
jgi:hypothetical protein